MSEMVAKRPRAALRRRILLGLVVVLLLALVARVGMNVWAGRQIDRVVSRLEERFGTLDVRTLAAPAVAPDANLARAVRGAAALLNYAPRTSWSEYQASYTAFLKQQDPAGVPADLRAFAESNRSVVRVVEDARGRAQSNWEADYATQANVPQFLDIRTLSNAIYLTTRIDLEGGRADDAARSIVAGLSVSSSLRQEQNLIAQLIRIAVGTPHFESVQRLLGASEPSGAALEMLAAALIANQSPDPLNIGLLSELKFFNDAMARAERGEAASVSPLAHAGRLWLTRPFARLARLRYLELLEHLLELQTGARPRPEARSTALPRWAVFERFADVASAGLERAMYSGDLFNSELALTELAVALRRYRLDHGQYPDALAALVPAYLPGVPTDPFTGKPPMYERHGAGFRLHGDNGGKSVGPSAATLDWNVPK